MNPRLMKHDINEAKYDSDYEEVDDNCLARSTRVYEIFN